MTNSPPTSVPVTVRALLQRVNRRLRADDQKLVTARGERVRTELGNYYLLDTARNRIIEQHVDLGELAREVGALAGHESVVAR